MPPPPPFSSFTKTRRSGSGNGSGSSTMPLTIEKIAVDAPMPSASVARMIAVKAGVFAYERAAKRMSWRSESSSIGVLRSAPADPRRHP